MAEEATLPVLGWVAPTVGMRNFVNESSSNLDKAAALAGLGWVASPVISNLAKDSIDYLGSDILQDLNKDLETTLLPQIQLTVKAAQHSTPSDMTLVARWLTRLKNAYYDAEAILHELKYGRLKRKAKGDDNVDKALNVTQTLMSPPQRKLLQQLKKLAKVAAEVNNYRHLQNIQKTANNEDVLADNSGFGTSSLSTIDNLFGREGDADEIIDFLLDKGHGEVLHKQGGNISRKSYSVVAVTGVRGTGKTTLAQYVYNDRRVKKYYPMRMWLCLSQKWNIMQHTKEMIECATGEKCPNLPDLDALQNKLTETLPESRNIMVVLDNVWYVKEIGENKWDQLLKPLVSRGGTCKFMVTSRSTSFPSALSPRKHIKLTGLTTNDFISLLRYHAVDGLQINNPQLKNSWSKIVDQIAPDMNKLPGAAKDVGKLLRNQPADIRVWRATLENINLRDTASTKSFLWTFYHFDVELQRCFLFCSVFPKGTRYDLDSLISYWVTLDFIQPSDGLEYFHEMVANSIFYLVDKTPKTYMMYDHFHDLAEKLSAEDCFRVTNSERIIPSTVQHIFLKVNNKNLREKISSICKLSNLRTLILGNQLIDDISEIIPIISTNFRNLRILDIQSWGYKKLPRLVGDFRNLRLLHFGMSSKIEELSNSLQLYHIQFLQLPLSVKTLPTNFTNFINLRFIKMYNSNGRQVFTLPPVPYLGKLTSLQCLDEFHVRKEEGYELQQLGPLKEIGGTLRIVNLENVRDEDEAVKAKLIDKPKLKKLELVWAELAEKNGLDKEIIEKLQPPANLEYLTIDGYRGSTYPNWLQEGSSIRNIKDVRFYNCNALLNLPPDFHQLCHCSELILQNLGVLRKLSTFPETLVGLSIIKCPCLIFVCENELQVNENQEIFKRRFLRCGIESCKDILDQELKSFKQTGSIESCPDQLNILESVTRGNAPKHWANVNRAWWCCHQQRLNFIYKSNTRAELKLPSKLRTLHRGYCCVSDEALSDCLKKMDTLEELYLSGIMTITTLPSEEVLKALTSLGVLEIKECWYLRSLGGLHKLPHLERCLVIGCLCLEMENDYTSKISSKNLLSFIINSYIYQPSNNKQ